MIILNKSNPFNMGKEFKNVNKKLDKFFAMLEGMKKPLIKDILKEVKDNKIELMYSNEEVDARIIIPNKDNTKVYVNISAIAKNLDNSIARGNIALGMLYSYLIQGYTILKWDKIKRNRDLRNDAIAIHADMLTKVLLHKGVGSFKNDQDKKKCNFLTSW